MLKIQTTIEGDGPEDFSPHDDITGLKFVQAQDQDFLEHLVKRAGIRCADFRRLFPECDHAKVLDGLCRRLVNDIGYSLAHELKTQGEITIEACDVLPEIIRKKFIEALGPGGEHGCTEIIIETAPDDPYDLIVNHLDELLCGDNPIYEGLRDPEIPALQS